MNLLALKVNLLNLEYEYLREGMDFGAAANPLWINIIIRYNSLLAVIKRIKEDK